MSWRNRARATLASGALQRADNRVIGAAMALAVACLLLGVTGGPIKAFGLELPGVTVLSVRMALTVFGAALVLGSAILWLNSSPNGKNNAILASGHEGRNRQIVLDRVRTRWIRGVLEQSRENLAWIEVRLERQPGALRQPGELVTYHHASRTRMIPSSTNIMEIFLEMGSALLVLGAPGSGKTTLLLELCSGLLDFAAADSEQPMPVIFNLSSWGLRRLALPEWLVSELAERYDVPREIGQAWVNDEQILPLLDGLDEVSVMHRDGCARAINDFREEHGFLPVAVCSRSAEYASLTDRLRLLGAVEIKPLSQSWVREYLNQSGKLLAGVRAVLRQDPVLWELLDSPLLVSLMVLAYMEKPASTVRSIGTADERRRHLFAAYIEAMFERRPFTSRYARHQTISWLAWLARSMSEYAQTEFYLERLQPSWLPTFWLRRIVTIGTPIIVALVSGLLFGLVLGVVTRLIFGPVAGAITGLIVAMAFGLLTGAPILLFAELQTIEPAEEVHWSWAAMRDRLIGRLLGGLIVGVGVGLLAGLAFGLVAGSVNGVVIGLANGLIDGVLSGVFLGLAGGLASGLLGGLSVGRMRVAQTTANQGIRRSAWHAVVSGLTVTLVVGVVVALLSAIVVGLVSGPAIGIYHGLISGLISGLLGGLIAALLGGGFACLQHFMLRSLLTGFGLAPWRYIDFLNYTSELGFLRRVGGGYIFVHRLLLEHFASLDPT